MKTIEQLRAEHEKQMTELTASHAAAESMPVPPHAVAIMGKRTPWVTYKCDSLRAMRELFEQFANAGRFRVVNMEDRKGTFRTVAPAIEHDPKYKTDHMGDYCAHLDVRHGEGYGPTVSFVFYVENSGKLYRINCELSELWNYKFAPQVHETQGRGNRLESRSFRPNAILSTYANRTLSYGSGDYSPIKTSSDIRYLFIADDGADCTEFGRMLECLESIEGAMK